MTSTNVEPGDQMKSVITAEQAKSDAPADTAPDSARASAGRGQWLRTILVRTLGIGLFLAVVIVYFSVSTDNFLTASNSVNVLNGIAVLGIASIAQTVVLVSGGVDLSVAGVIPLSCVVFVELSNGGTGLVLALIETVLIGVGVGIVNAVLITRVGMNTLIATLATMSVTAGLAYVLSNGTTVPLTNIHNGNLANIAVGGLPWYFFVFVVLVILFALLMRFTVFGRLVYALGGSREASVLAGIRVDLVSTAAYAISGALAALAGVVTASQLLAGSAGVGQDTMLMSVAAPVLGGAVIGGGKGSVTGTLGGVLVLGCLSNGLALMHVQSFYVQMITGIALLIAMTFSRLSQVLTR